MERSLIGDEIQTAQHGIRDKICNCFRSNCENRTLEDINAKNIV